MGENRPGDGVTGIDVGDSGDARQNGSSYRTFGKIPPLDQVIGDGRSASNNGSSERERLALTLREVPRKRGEDDGASRYPSEIRRS